MQLKTYFLFTCDIKLLSRNRTNHCQSTGFAFHPALNSPLAPYHLLPRRRGRRKQNNLFYHCIQMGEENLIYRVRFGFPTRAPLHAMGVRHRRLITDEYSWYHRRHVTHTHPRFCPSFFCFFFEFISDGQHAIAFLNRFMIYFHASSTLKKSSRIYLDYKNSYNNYTRTRIFFKFIITPLAPLLSPPWYSACAVAS